MISLVIPVYNEEILIEEVYERTRQALFSIGEDFEVIMIDDGSTDGTLSMLKACHEKDRRYKVLSLSRNFGHQAAYTAGLNYAKGDYIAMMDGDLQDPPELLKPMYQLIRESELDIVYGRRKDRKEKGPRRIFIEMFHSLYTRLANLKNIRNVGNFSIMTRKALNALISLKEKNRYLPGLRSFIGFRQGFVDYERQDRSKGEAKMSLLRLFALAFDAIFSFSSLPVKICLYSGLTGVLLIFFAMIYIVVSKITGLAPLGWSSIIMSVYFIGSVQLLSIGILGEYVYRIYKETQNRPIFIVSTFIE
jgi:polyisoprenyl-phosphate glycosyltransferase